MTRIWLQALTELRSFRVSKLSMAVSTLVLPTAYALIAVLTQPPHSFGISFLLSGSLMASLVSSLFYLTVIRISNFFQPEILELHAAFPIRRLQLALGTWLAYVTVSLPLTILLFALSVCWAPSAHIGTAIGGLAISYLMFIALASGLGLLVRNPYKAQGILGIVVWLMILVSPMQQEVSQIPAVLRLLLLANPVTHALNMIRPSLGFTAIVHPGISFSFGIGVTLLILPLVARAMRRVTILEKFF